MNTPNSFTNRFTKRPGPERTHDLIAYIGPAQAPH